MDTWMNKKHGKGYLTLDIRENFSSWMKREMAHHSWTSELNTWRWCMLGAHLHILTVTISESDGQNQKMYEETYGIFTLTVKDIKELLRKATQIIMVIIFNICWVI